MNALASVQNPFHPEIVVGFAGTGSVDQNLQLAPNETKDLELVIHAPAAARSAYDLPIMVKSGSDAAPLTDVATVKVQVPIKADLELQELSTDPVTLIKRFRLINKGDTPVADVQLQLDDSLKGKVTVRPNLQLFRLDPKQSTEFELVPIFQLSEHRNAAFAAKLQMGRAQRVDTLEARRLLQQGIGGTVTANSGAGKASQTTSYNVGNRSVFAVPLGNRHINIPTKLFVCTNQTHYDINIPTPPIPEVDDPFLLVTIEPSNPRDWPVEPHDIFFKVNGYPVGSINNQVPDGVYQFNVPASVLNLSDVGTTQQRIEMDTTVFNQAHYFRVGTMELHVFANKMVSYVAANNEEEALRIAQNQPYFEQHNDPAIDRVRAILKKRISLRASKWTFAVTFRWKNLFTPIFGPGMMNNMLYVDETDKQWKDFLAGYRCIGWQKFNMDTLAELKASGELGDVKVAPMTSMKGGHNFVVIWPGGSNPIDSGIIIDPWPTEGYEEVPLKKALETEAGPLAFTLPYQELNVQVELSRDNPPRCAIADNDGYVDAEYNQFGEDARELLFALKDYNSKKVRVLMQTLPPPSPLTPGTRPVFVAMAKGKVHLLATDGEGRRCGRLPSGELVNDFGSLVDIETDGQSSSLRASANEPRPFSLTLASAGDQTATVVVFYEDNAGKVQKAIYENIAVTQTIRRSATKSQGALDESGAALAVNPSMPPEPMTDADGQVMYPQTLDETGSDTLEVPRDPLRQVFPAGLNMISIPADVSGMDAAAILGLSAGETKLARWNPAGVGDNRYRLYPEAFASSVNVGKGFWALLPRTTPVELIAPTAFTARQNQPFAIQLIPGWNMLGNPFLSSLVWDVNAIRVRRGGQEMTLAQAQQAGWIEDFAWGFQQNASDPNTGRYVLIYDARIISNVVNQLEAWSGCWVLAKVDCEIILPQPSASSASLSRALSRRKPSRNDWTVTLSAETWGAKDSVSFGASPTGRSGGKLQIIKPPAAPGQGRLEMFLIAPDRPERLGVDVRRSLGMRETWDIIVRGAPRNADVTLRWDDLGRAPRPLRFHLIDEATGTRRYMRTTQSYTFHAGAGGEERKFRIELDATPTTGRLLNHLSVLNNGAQGAHFSFVLSQPATVNARIITPTGKVASVLARGMEGKQGLNTLTWNGKASNGASLPRGVYIMEVSAITEEGQEIRDVRTFTMR